MNTASPPQLFSDLPPPRRVVLVTGLSGAGRSSILHMLEDLGYEAVDNPPLRLIEELVTRGDRPAAIGIDTRSRGFDVPFVLNLLARLRLNPALRPELVFASATEDVLIRRYTETRRRHPLAPQARVVDGIAAEMRLLAPLREVADLILDTTGMALAALRSMVETRFGIAGSAAGMTVSLTSFAYPKGLPRDADLVFDMRFLRNPHYDPILRPKTGLDPDVASYVEADPDFEPYLSKITDLLKLLLPRFVEEGKKYVNIAIGCTGGRHRSVHGVQRLARWLESFRLQGEGSGRSPGGPQAGGSQTAGHGAGGSETALPTWRVVINHRELPRGEPGGGAGRGEPEQGEPGKNDLGTGKSGSQEAGFAWAQETAPIPVRGKSTGLGPQFASQPGTQVASQPGPQLGGGDTRGETDSDSRRDYPASDMARSAGLTMPAQAQEA